MATEVLTIGMPVFNDLQFIERSLISILNQDLRDFKLIISDDGSTDGSADICIRYEEKDSRVKYIRQKENLGISRNMEFLLSLADTPYFMWAADDDLWDPSFASNLISQLQEREDCIVAFGKYDLIDDNENILEKERSFDYSADSGFKRLLKLIRKSDDGFGYGVFKTNEIRKVKFPIWVWPNRRTAYNNIYPSLCFYLSKGNYFHYKEKSLFYKREKSGININHLITGSGNGLKETFSYMIRRLNLVFYSCKMIARSGKLSLAFICFPFLFHYWFVISSIGQFKLVFRSLKRKIGQ